MANSIPVIDSDYYNADNEGHIFVKLVNDSVLYLPEYNAESVRGRVRIVKLDTKYY